MKTDTTMRWLTRGRACALLAVSLTLGAGNLLAQGGKSLIFHQGAQPAPAAASPASSLPATAPTSASLPAPIAATPAAPVSTGHPHQAEVFFADGLLDVRANDSSLNQILRSVSRLTGMKIVGGVAEERVFGNYGPAEPATVLATLLDGTGSNMLLRETATDGPAELVLTPRTGGITPPSPYSQGQQDEADQGPPPPRQIVPVQNGGARQAQAPGPRSIPAPWNNVNGSPSNTDPTASTLPVTHSVPSDSIPTPSTTPSSDGIVDAPNPPPANSDTAINPTGAPGSSAGAGAAGTPANGSKTPEQIYQQLQQLLKQAQSGQTGTNTNSTPPATTPGSANPQ